MRNAPPKIKARITVTLDQDVVTKMKKISASEDRSLSNWLNIKIRKITDYDDSKMSSVQKNKKLRRRSD